MTRPRHDPRAELGSDVPFVDRVDAQDHGYWGQTPDTSDDSQFTVTGTEEGYEADDKVASSVANSTTAAKAQGAAKKETGK